MNSTQLTVRQSLSMNDTIVDITKIIFAGLFYGDLNTDIESERRLTEEKAVISKDCMKLFRAKMKDDVFFSTYSVLSQLLLQDGELSGGLPTRKLLGKVISEGDKLVNSGIFPTVQKAKELHLGELNDEALVSILTDEVKADYAEVCRKVVTFEAFQVALQDYINEFTRVFMQQSYAIAANILDLEGMTVQEGRKQIYLSGMSDASDYIADKTKYIMQFENNGVARGYVYDNNRLKEREKERGVEEPLFGTGISEIDSVYGDLRRGQVLAILGPMKGGKTSFSMYLAARALAKGLNVAVWITDGLATEWEDGIRVSLLSNGLFRGNAVDINRGDLARGLVADDSYEGKSLAAIDQALASNSDLGRLSFITDTAYAENLEKDLLSHYKNLNPFDVLIFDTPLNMQSLTRGRNKVEMLSTGMIELAHILRYRLPTKVASVWTGQIKQSDIDYILSHPDEELSITSAAESSEMIKTPDRIFAVVSTKDQRSFKQTTITEIASRQGGDIPKFDCGADLASLKYWSD